MKPILITFALFVAMTNGISQTSRNAEEAEGLAPGSKAPLFKALDAKNQEFDLAEALKTGPIVLIFYRGEWCPYCNRHLALVQDSLSLITEKGATVVAVSPQKPEYLDKIIEKTKAEFKVLYDEGYKISDAYDVTFTPEKKTLFTYNTFLNAKLKKSQSDESQRLPIPATYIIDRRGSIVWRHFNPDYHKRSSVKEILENLPG